MKTPPPTKPVPIRFTAETQSRIERASKKMAINRASIVRMAVHALLPQIEAGQIQLCKN